MDEIWLVESGIMHGGSTVLGVFSSKPTDDFAKAVKKPVLGDWEMAVDSPFYSLWKDGAYTLSRRMYSVYP